MSIQLFDIPIDATLVFQIAMPIFSIILIIFAYLNYRKKPATVSKVSQSMNNSSGATQQSADNMNIGNQTIIILNNCAIINGVPDVSLNIA